ncbi:MAG: nickel pincer cofactor biosynthesis protein LarB, partial [Candidatus Binataceae bacterium]
MTEARIRELLEAVAAGRLTADSALGRLRNLPFDDLGFARLDNHRLLRRGVPEVVFGDGKTADQIATIGRAMARSGVNLIVTRLAPDKARGVKRKLPALDYRAEARVGVVLHEPPVVSGHGKIVIVSAGTSDIPVAEEAAVCAELFGNRVERVYDVGVAGLHRLAAQAAALQSASVLIVVAGMEGALPSVVAGLVDKPVVAVPTSV